MPVYSHHEDGTNDDEHSLKSSEDYIGASVKKSSDEGNEYGVGARRGVTSDGGLVFSYS
jgi:hypothetical protein|tara:strand:+ start:14898 stop:15074 length:177 start_codon:yes stop_codon:yes gene_type:complete